MTPPLRSLGRRCQSPNTTGLIPRSAWEHWNQTKNGCTWTVQYVFYTHPPLQCLTVHCSQLLGEPELVPRYSSCIFSDILRVCVVYTMSYIPHFARVHGKKLFVTLPYFLSFEMRHDSKIQLPVYILYTEFLHTPIAPKAIIIIEVAFCLFLIPGHCEGVRSRYCSPVHAFQGKLIQL